MKLDAANAEQSAYWNGEGGRHWVAQQESQDKLFAPITAALFDAARPTRGEVAIDVGCGAGETTLRLADAGARALGVDLSAPLIARARERASAATARFLQCDATAYDFSDEAADLMISRFGVMFFAEPEKAFANLARGLKQGARLAFVCWRPPALNPWLMLPYQAATKHAPPLPKLGPEDPGPFSFAGEARVHRILGAAGFADIAMAPRDFMLDVGVGEGVEAAVAKVLELGPASRALIDQPDDVRTAATREIRAAFNQVARDGAVPLAAAIWVVTARRA